MSDDELFLTALLKCSRSDLYTRKFVLTDSQQRQLDLMRQRRLNQEPVQYICGFTEFMGLRMDVGPGVLVPRPETEILADQLIRELKAGTHSECRVLDLGTGSGCLAISVASFVRQAHIVAVDSSAEALAFAIENARRNAVQDSVSFLQMDMFAFMEQANAEYDAIVSNPPYIPSLLIDGLPADVRMEPRLALDGGADGLDYYRRLIPLSLRILKSGAMLFLEFGDGQQKDLQNIFEQEQAWDKIRLLEDNTGRPRVIMACKNKFPLPTKDK